MSINVLCPPHTIIIILALNTKSTPFYGAYSMNSRTKKNASLDKYSGCHLFSRHFLPCSSLDQIVVYLDSLCAALLQIPSNPQSLIVFVTLLNVFNVSAIDINIKIAI